MNTTKDYEQIEWIENSPDLKLLNFTKSHKDDLLASIDGEYEISENTFNSIKSYLMVNYQNILGFDWITDKNVNFIMKYFIHDGSLKNNDYQEIMRKNSKFKSSDFFYEDELKLMGVNEDGLNYLLVKYLKIDLIEDEEVRFKLKLTQINYILQEVESEYNSNALSLKNNEFILKLFNFINFILKDADFQNFGCKDVIVDIHKDYGHIIDDENFHRIFKDLNPKELLTPKTVLQILSKEESRKSGKSIYIKDFVERNTNFNNILNNLNSFDVGNLIKIFDTFIDKIDPKKIDLPLLIEKIKLYENKLKKAIEIDEKNKVDKMLEVEHETTPFYLDYSNLMGHYIEIKKDELLKIAKIYDICNNLIKKKKIDGIKLNKKR